MKETFGDILCALGIALLLLLYALFTMSCAFLFVLWSGGVTNPMPILIIKGTIIFCFWVAAQVYVLVKQERN